MDADLRESMLQYYDERAPEYDDAYLRGTGTASIRDPSVFQLEATLLGEVVERMARGRVVDLACGTGYWLQYYAQRCSRVTLVDQSVWTDKYSVTTSIEHVGAAFLAVSGQFK